MPITYNNPASGRPEFPAMPGGALAGVMAARDRNMYEENMGLAQKMQEMEAAKQLEELQMGAPVRTAERGQKMTEADLAAMIARQAQQTPGYAEGQVAGTMGQAQSRAAEGRIAQGTAEGRIGLTNEENRRKQTQEFLSRMDSSRPLFEDSTPVAPGVTRGAQAYQEFLQSVPEAARRHLPPEYDSKKMDSIRQSLINSVGQQQALGLEAKKNEGVIAHQRVTNEGTLAVAKERRQANQKSLMQNFQAAKTPEQVVTAGEMIMADPDVDTPTKEIVRRGVESAKRIIAEKLARGQIDFNDLRNSAAVPNAINQRLGGAGSQGNIAEQFKNTQANPDKWLYEPGKYDYQIGPGGKLQRRAKTQP